MRISKLNCILILFLILIINAYLAFAVNMYYFLVPKENYDENTIRNTDSVVFHETGYIGADPDKPTKAFLGPGISIITDGKTASAINTFTNPNSEKSADFVIAENGDIFIAVDENNVPLYVSGKMAYHVGNDNPNYYGIEVSRTQSETDNNVPLLEAQISSLLYVMDNLLKPIGVRNPVPHSQLQTNHEDGGIVLVSYSSAISYFGDGLLNIYESACSNCDNEVKDHLIATLHVEDSEMVLNPQNTDEPPTYGPLQQAVSFAQTFGNYYDPSSCSTTTASECISKSALTYQDFYDYYSNKYDTLPDSEKNKFPSKTFYMALAYNCPSCLGQDPSEWDPIRIDYARRVSNIVSPPEGNILVVSERDATLTNIWYYELSSDERTTWNNDIANFFRAQKENSDFTGIIDIDVLNSGDLILRTPVNDYTYDISPNKDLGTFRLKTDELVWYKDGVKATESDLKNFDDHFLHFEEPLRPNNVIEPVLLQVAETVLPTTIPKEDTQTAQIFLDRNVFEGNINFDIEYDSSGNILEITSNGKTYTYNELFDIVREQYGIGQESGERDIYELSALILTQDKFMDSSSVSIGKEVFQARDYTDYYVVERLVRNAAEEIITIQPVTIIGQALPVRSFTINGEIFQVWYNEDENNLDWKVVSGETTRDATAEDIEKFNAWFEQQYPDITRPSQIVEQAMEHQAIIAEIDAILLENIGEVSAEERLRFNQEVDALIAELDHEATVAEIDAILNDIFNTITPKEEQRFIEEIDQLIKELSGEGLITPTSIETPEPPTQVDRPGESSLSKGFENLHIEIDYDLSESVSVTYLIDIRPEEVFTITYSETNWRTFKYTTDGKVSELINGIWETSTFENLENAISKGLSISYFDSSLKKSATASIQSGASISIATAEEPQAAPGFQQVPSVKDVERPEGASPIGQVPPLPNAPQEPSIDLSSPLTPLIESYQNNLGHDAPSRAEYGIPNPDGGFDYYRIGNGGKIEFYNEELYYRGYGPLWIETKFRNIEEVALYYEELSVERAPPPDIYSSPLPEVLPKMKSKMKFYESKTDGLIYRVDPTGKVYKWTDDGWIIMEDFDDQVFLELDWLYEELEGPPKFTPTQQNHINELTQQAAQKLTNNLLNLLLGEFAYDQVSQICKEDWESSEPASDIPRTASSGIIDPLQDINQNGLVNNCQQPVTTVTAQATKTKREADFSYQTSWTINPCKQSITYTVYIANSLNDRVGLASGSTNKAKLISGSKQFNFPTNYNLICIQVSDATIGDNGYSCFDIV